MDVIYVEMKEPLVKSKMMWNYNLQTVIHVFKALNSFSSRELSTQLITRNKSRIFYTLDFVIFLKSVAAKNKLNNFAGSRFSFSLLTSTLNLRI